MFSKGWQINILKRVIFRPHKRTGKVTEQRDCGWSAILNASEGARMSTVGTSYTRLFWSHFRCLLHRSCDHHRNAIYSFYTIHFLKLMSYKYKCHAIVSKRSPTGHVLSLLVSHFQWEFLSSSGQQHNEELFNASISKLSKIIVSMPLWRLKSFQNVI